MVTIQQTQNMSRRVCTQRTEREKFQLLRQWQSHPEWTLRDASHELGVYDSTLRGWKEQYWHRLDEECGSHRKRRKGGGRKYKTKPYEGRIIDYFDNMRASGRGTFSEMLHYCRNIEEFTADITNPNSQNTWVRRFIERYSKPGPADVVVVVPGVPEHLQDAQNNPSLPEASQDVSASPQDVQDAQVALQDVQDAQVASQDVSASPQDVQDAQDASQEEFYMPQDVQDASQDAQEVSNVFQGKTIGGQHLPGVSQCLQDAMQDVQEAIQVGLDVPDGIQSDDDEQYHVGMLVSLFSKDTTYKAALLCKNFRLFYFLKAPKVTAYELRNMQKEAIVSPNKLVQILPWSVIRQCQKAISSLQNKREGVGELGMVVKVATVGILTPPTVAAMKRWHEVTKVIDTLEKAFVWITKIDFTLNVDRHFRVIKDQTLESRLKVLPVFSPQMELIEIAGKGSFSDATFEILLEKLFSGPKVVCIKPTTMLVVVEGAVSIDTHELAKLFFGLSNEIVLLPINCNGIHWCSIMVKLASSEVLVYDPMGSSYLANVRGVAQTVIPLLPTSRTRYRLQIGQRLLPGQTAAAHCRSEP